MNTLWVFGDSFASDKNHWYYYNNQRDEWKCPDWFWPNQLANKLNCDLKLTALPGVSNEWISHQVRTTLNKQQFQQNDFIVIVTTQPDRRWFMPQYPSLANIYINNLNKYLTRRQYKALTLYKEEFLEQHQFLSKIYYEQFLTWIHSVLKSYRYCLLPGFDSTRLHHVCNEWSMCNAEEAEFGKGADDKHLVEKIWEGADKRLCHFSKNNHAVLSDKIVKFFYKNELIDLSTGFSQKLFTCDKDLVDYTIES